MKGVGSLTAYAQPTDASPEAVGAVNLHGAGSLWVNNAGVFMRGRATLTVKPAQLARVVMTGKGAMLAEATRAVTGYAFLPALDSIGGDRDDYGEARYQDLPGLVSAGDGGFYIPPQPVSGYGSLPVVISTGQMTAVHIANGDVTLPALDSLGGDYNYGEAREQQLPGVGSFAYYGYRLIAEIFTACYGNAPVMAKSDSIVVFTETGELVDSFTVDRILAGQIVEQVTCGDTYTLQAVLRQEFIEEVFGRSKVAGQVEDRPGLPGRVWVLNMDTAASSQYDNYGFNSFFTRGGITYGVAEDGIYQLEGNKDAGRNIDALLEVGRSSYGDHKEKKILNVYLGVGADRRLYLKVETDGQEKTYLMDNKNVAMKTQRVKIPHTMIGSHWSFTLMNEGGGDFDIESIAFTPVSLARRY